MFDLVLLQPQIPSNTGNIIRLCANTGCRLHLIRPLGFVLNDKKLRRAGLDYHHLSSLSVYNDFRDFLRQQQPKRIIAIETCGSRDYHQFSFQPDDALLFGAETSGISSTILKQLPAEHILKIPMRDGSRSLNLANTVAIVTFEAWRQHNFI